MKMYFYSIKITLHLIKYIFIISPLFHHIKTFAFNQKNLYSIKYIFIISPFVYGIKIDFHSVKINLCSVRNIFMIKLSEAVRERSSVKKVFLEISERDSTTGIFL